MLNFFFTTRCDLHITDIEGFKFTIPNGELENTTYQVTMPIDYNSNIFQVTVMLLFSVFQNSGIEKNYLAFTDLRYPS
jgi:hypothetical protein